MNTKSCIEQKLDKMHQIGEQSCHLTIIIHCNYIKYISLTSKCTEIIALLVTNECLLPKGVSVLCVRVKERGGHLFTSN